MDMPEPYIDAMFTFKLKNNIITKRGFYSDLFNNISIPNEWRIFNGELLPHGFHNNIILSKKSVISWKYCK